MICRYLPYRLSLRAPAVLTSLGGDPNSSQTLPCIPGSALRGAAARQLGDPGTDPQRLSRFRRLILDGSARYLHAYPSVEGRRALPTPVSLRIDKTDLPGSEGQLNAWDLAAFAGSDGEEPSWPDAPLAPVSEPFVTVGAAQPLRVSPARGSRVHQQRDRARGRAWTDPQTEEAHGTIYTFEFLEAGQEFAGFVQLCADDETTLDALASDVKQVLRPPILVGRSRRGGYGGDADITWGDARDRELTGQGVIASDLQAEMQFRVLLLSAYVGRNPETGQLDPSYLADEVVERLGGRARVVRRRWAFELAGGFNRKWRLEVPQALACAAGSVLVLEATEAIPFPDLLAVEQGGLGERRVEGFGRVAFLDAPARTQVLRVPSPAPKPLPAGDAPELVRFAEARVVDAAVERAIEEEAARLARSATRIPAPSLLGRLRNAMRADARTALQTLQTWLGQEGSSGERLRRPAMDQLERCRLEDDQRLSDWLRAMAGHGGGEKIKELLRFDALAQRNHIVSEESAHERLNERLIEIRAGLIESVLAALARQHRLGRSS